jgi:N-acetylneuraminic acid mutarotase
MPSNRSGFALAVYQNKIYIIGGSNGLTQIYDPAKETWENRTSMPTPRTQLEANIVKGKIYLIGGKTGGPYSTVALNEVYDPTTDTWTAKEPIPVPVAQYASAVVDDKIYVIGGQDEFKLPNPNLNITQIYDTLTDTWTFGAPLPYVVWQADAGATSGKMAPKRIYVMGGLSEGNLYGTDLNQIYDPATNTWSLGSCMPLSRAKLYVAVVNDVLYSMGGYPFINFQATYSTENYQYIPIGYIPEFPSWIILPVLLVVTLAAMVLKKRLT